MSALAKKLDQYCSRTDHQGNTEGQDRSVVLFLVGLVWLTGLKRAVSGKVLAATMTLVEGGGTVPTSTLSTATARMTPAFRLAAMRASLLFHLCDGGRITKTAVSGTANESGSGAIAGDVTAMPSS